MLWFFLVVSSMAVCAIAIMVLPMMRSRTPAADGREQQNILIAKERLALLQEQIDQGVLAEEEAAEARKEIELGLLDDIESAAATGPGKETRGSWAGIVVAMGVLISSGILYIVLGKPESFTVTTQPGAADVASPEGHSDVDIGDVVAKLENELAQDPDNPEGWYLLGSTYMTLQRYGEAATAFGRLRELVGDDPDLLVREADAIAMSNQGVLSGRPEALLKKALELNPDQPVALWLSGIAAEGRGDLEEALRHWQRAEPLLADTPQSQAEIQAQIARARARLEQGDIPILAPAAPVAEAGPDPAAGGALRVRVTLDASLQKEVTGDETLFVLARALNGPPMPLAVVRKRASELPLEVTLDDSMAMMPTLKLSSHEQVTVVAKLSRSGDAATRSGDLVGEVSPVAPGSPDTVDVVISGAAP